MSNRVGKLFLGGGGDENQSFELDQKFAIEIGEVGQVLYLPMAQQGDESRYASCFDWFTSTMQRHAISKNRLTMWTTFSNRRSSDLSEFKGIYIGGGMTGALCKLMHAADMSSALSKFLLAGNSIYGGSAGAIALGGSLLPIPEEMLGSGEEAERALGLLPQLSFRCHYRRGDRVADTICRGAAKRLPGQRIIAIPETAGLICTQKDCLVVGIDSVFQFYGDEVSEIPPNSTIRL